MRRGRCGGGGRWLLPANCVAGVESHSPGKCGRGVKSGGMGSALMSVGVMADRVRNQCK